MKTQLASLGLACAVIALVATAGSSVAAQRPGTVEVYKSPTCGCCALWVKHLEANGFTTRVTEREDLAPIKTKHGVPAKAGSCHTAIVDGYVVEGHVPAADIKRLLKERPAVVGLAVPGMPIGSPGMEFGSTVQPYNVLSFDRSGQVKVYSTYGK